MKKALKSLKTVQNNAIQWLKQLFFFSFRCHTFFRTGFRGVNIFLCRDLGVVFFFFPRGLMWKESPWHLNNMSSQSWSGMSIEYTNIYQLASQYSTFWPHMILQNLIDKNVRKHTRLYSLKRSSLLDRYYWNGNHLALHLMLLIILDNTKHNIFFGMIQKYTTVQISLENIWQYLIVKKHFQLIKGYNYSITITVR